MPRRTITDEEIGLIKAMLRRGMRNRDIQFYFNRQDRPVNSGRITNIRNGDYGPEVPEATDAELDAFLARFQPAEVGVVIEGGAMAEPSLAEKARARFVQRGEEWHLADGETVEQECKLQFAPRRMEPIIRAIAALANHRGGFIFIGVDDDGRVVGMPDTTFQETDLVRITDKAKHLLTPTPVFAKEVVEFGELSVGVIHVEEYPVPPVVVCRDAKGIEDGTILFRYPGQSGKIKFGDLQELLRKRDRAVQQALLGSAARLSEIGTDRALIVDTDKGELDAGTKRIVIDRELAEKLEFIREGEFDEREGAPTLRLVGDVQAVDAGGRVIERIEGRALSPDMVLQAYLTREQVRSPMQYVKFSALAQRQWLPLFYFIRQAGSSIEDAIAELKATDAVYRRSKESALERLRGDKSAYAAPSRLIEPVVAAVQAGDIGDLRERFEDRHIVMGIQGLPDEFRPDLMLKNLLWNIFQDAHDNANLKSSIFRAAARLDELEAN